MRSAQQLGFTLAEIEEIIRYSLQRHSPCPLVRDIIRRRLDDTRQQLDRLLAMHERMERALHAWAKLPDSIPTGNNVCALIEAVAATEGGRSEGGRVGEAWLRTIRAWGGRYPNKK